MSADPRPASQKKSGAIAVSLLIVSGVCLAVMCWGALSFPEIEEGSQSGELAWMGIVAGGCLILIGAFRAVFSAVQGHRQRPSQNREPEDMG